MRLLTAALLAGALPAQAAEMPEWFAETLFDVREEAAEAAKQGKQLMLYFWLTNCPYCERMTKETFSDPGVVARLKRGFVPVGVNIRGDRDIVWTDGAALSEKEITRRLKLRGTPTIVFLDAKGEIALRLVGYVPPAEFARALDSLSTAPKAGPRSASPM